MRTLPPVRRTTMLKKMIRSRWLLAMLTIVMIGLLAGCGSKVDTDWDPITPEEARHPFDYGEHGEYLATNDYAFDGCTQCHGDELRGVELGDPADPVRACTACHRTENHIIYFDNAFEHIQWMGENEYAMDDCFVCHKSSELAAQGPEVQFGATCGTAEGCHDVTLGPKACNTCHGEMDEDPSVFENMAPDEGAHSTHLLNDGPYATIYCSACHVQPLQAEAAGHYNDDTPGMVEITFGEVASSGGSDPQWDTDNSTCSNVYCHGGVGMDWRFEDVIFTCSSCHTYPPENGHPNSDACNLCHGATVGPDDDGDGFVDIVNPQSHADGTVDFN